MSLDSVSDTLTLTSTHTQTNTFSSFLSSGVSRIAFAGGGATFQGVGGFGISPRGRGVSYLNLFNNNHTNTHYIILSIFALF